MNLPVLQGLFHCGTQKRGYDNLLPVLQRLFFKKIIFSFNFIPFLYIIYIERKINQKTNI